MFLKEVAPSVVNIITVAIFYLIERFWKRKVRKAWKLKSLYVDRRVGQDFSKARELSIVCPICHSEQAILRSGYACIYTYICIYIQFIPQPGSTGWAWLDVLRALCATKGLDVERESTTHFPPRESCVTVPKDRPLPSLFPTTWLCTTRLFTSSNTTRQTSTTSLIQLAPKTLFRFVRSKGTTFKRIPADTSFEAMLPFPFLVTEILQPFYRRTREGLA